MRAIKVSDKAHRRLKMMSAKSSEHIYEIVDDLVQRLYDGLLHHSSRRDHKSNPARCSGCLYVDEAIERDKKR